MTRILLVEDDPVFLLALASSLTQAGYEVRQASTVAAARAALREHSADVMLLDMLLPDGDGFSLLPEVAARAPELPVIILSSHHDPAAVVRALRAGAVDYLAKPPAPAELQAALQSAIAHARRRQRLGTLYPPQAQSPEEGTQRSGTLALPIGSSPAWQRALDLLCAAAQGPRTTVLLTGEPGVGKEVAATLLHHLSARSRQPFVVVNAACLTPNLIESELFGHEVGAFTGAQQRRRGLFEMASSGALFLDEIGELPLDLQAKLLRVLEGHPFRRVGGERDLSVDVRLICATNRDLAAQVAAGRFRADLYHRLRVFEVALPPLRERRSDIPELALYFCRLLGVPLGYPDPRISTDAMSVLVAHHWPGNVRELRNVIERALLLSRGQEIARRHLPAELALAPLPALGRPTPDVSPSATPAAPAAATPVPGAPLSTNLEDCIRRQVLLVYEHCGGNLTRAAAALGISRMALRRRLHAYGVK
jgi:DNA-binding NtrC family response regulator